MALAPRHGQYAPRRGSERELGALDEAAEETGISDLTNVTLHEGGLERAGAREVRVVPAWRYLLEVES